MTASPFVLSSDASPQERERTVRCASAIAPVWKLAHTPTLDDAERAVRASVQLMATLAPRDQAQVHEHIEKRIETLALSVRERAVLLRMLDETEADHEQDRPEISIDSDDLEPLVDKAIAALARGPVFQRGGQLVDVVHAVVTKDGRVEPTGTPRPRLIPQARLREVLDGCATWIAPRADGRDMRVRVPRDVVEAVAARGEWSGIRPIDGVVEYPVMRPDWSIATEHGYDEQTRLLVEPSIVVEVPDKPTLEDARHAIDLLRDPTADFPIEDVHFSCWLAALLTVIARPAIDGPVPRELHFCGLKCFDAWRKSEAAGLKT